MKRITLKLCATLTLALTIVLTMGPTACYAEVQQATEAVEVDGVLTEENQTATVETTEPMEETQTEEYIDMYSIPEQYRTNDNYGPAFAKEGVHKSVLAESLASQGVENMEEIFTTSDSEARVMTIEEDTITEEPLEPQPTNRWGITLTPEEKAVLAQIVYKEAGNQSDVGEQAVVEVVLNRMYSPNWPSSCIGVLSQKGQFSTWRGRNSARVTEREYRNIEAVLNGQTNILPYKTVYFSRGAQNKRIQTRIEGHVFCNEK